MGSDVTDDRSVPRRGAQETHTERVNPSRPARIRTALAHAALTALGGKTHRQAAQLEQLRHDARCLGLTPEQTTEVIDTWTAWYATTLLPVDLVTIRRALVRRAMREKWSP